MKTYYVSMDGHRASIVMVVLNGAGKVVMQSGYKPHQYSMNCSVPTTLTGPTPFRIDRFHR
jgi:hypothetical protein